MACGGGGDNHDGRRRNHWFFENYTRHGRRGEWRSARRNRWRWKDLAVRRSSCRIDCWPSAACCWKTPDSTGARRAITRRRTPRKASSCASPVPSPEPPMFLPFLFSCFFFHFLLPTFPHLCGRLSFPYQGGVSAKRAWPTRVETFSVRSSFSTQQVALRSTRSFDFLTCPTTFSRVRWGSILFVFFSRSCELPHAST